MVHAEEAVGCYASSLSEWEPAASCSRGCGSCGKRRVLPSFPKPCGNAASLRLSTGRQLSTVRFLFATYLVGPFPLQKAPDTTDRRGAGWPQWAAGAPESSRMSSGATVTLTGSRS